MPYLFTTFVFSLAVKSFQTEDYAGFETTAEIKYSHIC